MLYHDGDTYPLTDTRRLVVADDFDVPEPDDQGTPPTEVFRHPRLFRSYGGGELIESYGDTLDLGDAMRRFDDRFRDWEDVLTRYASIFHGADILITYGDQAVQGSEFVVITEVTDDWREMVGASEFYQPSTSDAAEILAYHSGNTYYVFDQYLKPGCPACGSPDKWESGEQGTVVYGYIDDDRMRDIAWDFR